MRQKTIHWICYALFMSAIIVLSATSTMAQMGGFGIAGGEGGGGGMGIGMGQSGYGGMAGTSIRGPIAGLPKRGILAVRNSIRVGGVTISEVRGLAVVLSANPLVLVTGKELLQVGEEYPDEVQGAVSSVICSYYTPVFDMEGMGGMDGGAAGMGGGMGGGDYAGVRTDFVLEPRPLIVRDGESNLLFIFATAKVEHSSFLSARLAKNPNPTDDWLKSAWLEGENPEVLKEDANAPTIATIAPDGSVALIVDGKVYGRDAIMKEYLQVYNSQVREDEAFRSEDNKGLQVQAARQQVDFAKQQWDLQIASGKFMDESLQNELRAAQIKLQQAEKEVSALEAELVEKKNKRAVAEDAFNAGLVPREELVSKQEDEATHVQKIQKASYAVQEALSTLEAKQKELDAKRGEIEIKNLDAQNKFLAAQDRLQSALKQLANGQLNDTGYSDFQDGPGMATWSKFAGPTSPNSVAIPPNQAAAVAPMDSPALLERSSGQSALPPLTNTIQGRRMDAPNPRSDRIVNAVVEAKKASDEAQAAKARSQLRELLEIEFDAQRTQKAIELESLRQRIQQLEEAEEELKGQRDQTIEQRLNRLLGKPAR